MYFGFLEYGKDLSREDVWLPNFICRSALVNQLASSIGQCFKAILETMFSNPLANPLTGVKLKSSTGNHVILHWTLSMFLQDGSAQKFAFSNRQGAGFRICMLCGNIFWAKVARDFSLADEVKESQPSLRKFRKLPDLQLVDNLEILGSWQRMQARKDWSSKEWVERLQWPCFAAFHETAWTTATSAMFTILPWLYACPLFQRGFVLRCFLAPRWIVVQWATQCLEDTVWIFATLDPTSPIFCSKIKKCWRTQGQQVFEMQCQWNASTVQTFGIRCPYLLLGKQFLADCVLVFLSVVWSAGLLRCHTTVAKAEPEACANACGKGLRPLGKVWLGSQHAAKDALATSLAACVAKMAMLASLLELGKKT